MIRKATFDDAAAIARIHVGTWRVAYTDIVPDDFLANLSEEKRTQSWRDQLTDGRTIIWAAETQTHPVMRKCMRFTCHPSTGTAESGARRWPRWQIPSPMVRAHLFEFSGTISGRFGFTKRRATGQSAQRTRSNWAVRILWKFDSEKTGQTSAPRQRRYRSSKIGSRGRSVALDAARPTPSVETVGKGRSW